MTTPTRNGTAHPPASSPSLHPSQVKPQLQRQLAEALTSGQFKKARRLCEAMLWWDDFGGSDLLDKVRPGSNDGPGWLSLAPPSVPSDRRHGQRWPVWRTQQELDLLRQESRLRLAGNSYAQGLLKNLTNNVIGKGFAYAALPITKKGEEATEEQEALAAKVQEVVDNFCRLNNWNGGTHPDSSGVVVNTREKEIYRRVKGEDGECFLRFHFQNDGTTKVRFIEPERVRSFNDLPQKGESFGIRHQMEPFEDVETPLEYCALWPDPSATGGEGENNGEPEYIPADEVLHLRGPDTPATVKRGISSFLFDVGKALDRAAKLQRNASLGAAYRAATGEIWQHHVGTQAQIQDLASSLGVDGPTNGQSPNSGLETVEHMRAPSVRRVPAGQELVPLPPDQSESYLAAGQGDLRQAASAFCAPEFWMAETSSGNYSNLESAAAPAVRDGQSEQEYYKTAFGRAVWKAIMWAVECGLLPEGIEDEVKLEVQAPAVLHRDEDKKAQQDQVYNQLRVKSQQTISAELGLDYEVEQSLIEKHEDRWGSPMDALMQPGEEKPGEGGDNGDEDASARPPSANGVGSPR